jgi:hypothetical protein
LETIASTEALSLADDLNVRKASIGSDCQGILCNILDSLGGANAAIVKAINDYTTSFEAVCFIHEGRQHIVEAHNLARAPTSLEPCAICGC